MKTVILVPFRAADARREQLWLFTRKWLEQRHSWPIIIGESPDGPFNRSAAINHAAAQQDWDVAVVHDADTVVPGPHLEEAVRTAQDSGRLTFAFTSVVDLDKDCADAILATGDISLDRLSMEGIRTSPLAIQSSALAVPRRLWEKVGGFDEQFVGWSAEDNAFCRAATLAGGEPKRVAGHAFHLWHEPAPRDMSDPNYARNQRRWSKYRSARTFDHLKTIAQWQTSL